MILTRTGVSVVLYGIAFAGVRNRLGLSRPGELARLERKAGYSFGGSRRLLCPVI